VLVLFVLVNGGLTYRQSCANADGTVSTSWTYRWFAPIPYLLSPSREGCETHTATRVLLAKIGLWTLPRHNAAQIAQATATDPGTAYYAGIYGIEVAFANAIKARNRAQLRTAIRDGDTIVPTLVAPDYLAADADDFQASWTRLSRDFDAAVAQPSHNADAVFTADVTHLVAVTQRIQRKVIAHRTK
jgi:hypothetical protein